MVEIFLVLTRSYGRSEKGVKLRRLAGPHANGRYSISLATCLRTPRGFYLSRARRKGANAAEDFLLFVPVVELIEEGILAAGDYLLLDNWGGHFARRIQWILLLLLGAVGARLIFLPTYSPECNPCELIFSHSKRALRAHRDHSIPFLEEIGRSYDSLTKADVIGFYHKCIFRYGEALGVDP